MMWSSITGIVSQLKCERKIVSLAKGVETTRPSALLIGETA